MVTEANRLNNWKARLLVMDFSCRRREWAVSFRVNIKMKLSLLLCAIANLTTGNAATLITSQCPARLWDCVSPLALLVTHFELKSGGEFREV